MDNKSCPPSVDLYIIYKIHYTWTSRGSSTETFMNYIWNWSKLIKVKDFYLLINLFYSRILP